MKRKEVKNSKNIGRHVILEVKSQSVWGDDLEAGGAGEFYERVFAGDWEGV